MTSDWFEQATMSLHWVWQKTISDLNLNWFNQTYVIAEKHLTVEAYKLPLLTEQLLSGFIGSQT